MMMRGCVRWWRGWELDLLVEKDKVIYKRWFGWAVGGFK